MHAADTQALGKMCQRFLQERLQLASGIEAMAGAMSVLRRDAPRDVPDAIEAVERIAAQSIDFAREVFHLLYQGQPTPGSQPTDQRR